MSTSKCLEYYLDSRIYNYEQVQKNIDEAKKEFPKQDITVEVKMNQFGMYIITLYLKNKNTIFNKIKVYLKKKSKNKILLQESNNIKVRS